MKLSLVFNTIINSAFLKKLKCLYNLLDSFLKKHFFIHAFILSFLSMIIIETFNRSSFSCSLVFMIEEFGAFVVGLLIVFFTVSISAFFKKKNFWKYFTVSCWIFLSIVNFIMFSFRFMPFSFNDILLIPSTFTVIPMYLSVLQMVLISLVVVSLIALVVVMYRKTKVVCVDYKKSTVCLAVSFFFTVMGVLGARYSGIVDNRIHGLISKYTRNGFVYCFASSIFERGMSAPDGYTKKHIMSIKNETNIEYNTDKIDANIVFLQLESFFNPNLLTGVTYSQNPIPYFESMKSSYSHGYLTVPNFGAGTANTEFEVISGMNIDYFGIGEVAYQTVVEDETVETVCHILKDQGYTTHGIHNNSAVFYNRNLVFKNLGFDTFTSLEYMYGVEYNPTGWAKDKVLISSIDDCLTSTEGRDLVYAIGVQPHGVYPENVEIQHRKVKVSGFEDIGSVPAFEYYISQLNEEDLFLESLTKYFLDFEEPTVIVIFGDHLPGFQIDETLLKNKNRYQTEYILWSNFDMDIVEKDLNSYQLYSYVLSRLSIHGNTLSNIHRKYGYKSLDNRYSNDFELVQFDLTEGNGYSSDNHPRKPTEARLGIRHISINSLDFEKGFLRVYGRNFNEFSKIELNGELIETKFVSNNELLAQYDKSRGKSTVRVCQVDEHGTILSTTEKIIQ